MILLLEHILCEALQVLVLYVHHAVLHELHACNLLGIRLYILFLDLDTEGLQQLVLSQVPFQFLQHLREVLIELLLGHLVVGSQYPAAQEGLGEGHLLHLLQDGSLGVQTEFVLRVLGHVLLNFRLDACAELSLVLRGVLAIYLGKQFAVDLSGFVAGDRLDFKREVRLQTLGLLLGDRQHGAYLHLAAVGLHRVEGHHVALLHFCEQLLLLLVLHILRVEDGVLLHDAALFLLGQRTAQDVAFLGGVHLYVLAVAGSVALGLTLYHLVGYLDLVLGQFVLAGQLSVKLRRYSDVERKGKRVLLVHVDVRRQLVVGHRIAQDSDLVVLDVLLQVLTYQLVQYVGQYTLAVHLLHQSQGYHTRTEARDLGFLTNLLQLLLYLVLVISRLDRERHNGLQVFQFTLFNFHNIKCYFISQKSKEKRP